MMGLLNLGSHIMKILKKHICLLKIQILFYAATQELIKEENNWLIRVPTNNNDFNITSIEGILSVNEKNT